MKYFNGYYQYMSTKTIIQSTKLTEWIIYTRFAKIWTNI